ncbi:MAG: tetratricopeptide repeat protein [Acidiferrobacterales bacterium]
MATSQVSVKTGIAAYRAGHYARAMTLLADLAQSGDGRAARYMAKSCEAEGRHAGCRPVIWWQIAAHHGDAASAYRLYRLYSTGDGVRLHPHVAIAWLKAAAGGGNVRAQAILGNLYALGGLVPKNFGKAFRWDERALIHGNGQAELDTAALFASGRGTAQDLPEAAVLYRLAAKQGFICGRCARHLMRAMTPREVTEVATAETNIRRERTWR